MSEEKRNMKISGSGSMPGGEFDKVSVSGAGKVDGSLRCEELNCSGSAKIAGNARVAERLHCSGSVKVEGDVGCSGEMHVSGAFQCGGDAAAQEFHGSGATRIGGELSGGELHVSGVLHAAGVHCTELRASGSLDIDGGVEAERAALSGLVKIGGLLNAEKLEFYPAGHCEVGDIGGADIRVLRLPTAKSLLNIFHTSPRHALRPHDRGRLRGAGKRHRRVRQRQNRPHRRRLPHPARGVQREPGRRARHRRGEF